MPRRQPRLSPRKQPSQARSTQLVKDILEGAVRVLVRDGGLRFTTVRVARAAGVSVGSLYQYFPNKESLLFRLQADEWLETWSALEALLLDSRHPPMDRMRRAVVAFFRSEDAEAALRVALDDAGALFRNAPEAKALEARSAATLERFLLEAAPRASRRERAFAADFLKTSMGAVAEKITEQGRSRAEVDAWAETCADLFEVFLERLGASGASQGYRSLHQGRRTG